jgi:uncharacterized protein (DUF433 family)
MSTATDLRYPSRLKEQAKALLESLAPEPPPLRLADGMLRVGATRVSLDSVIHAFNAGSAAEEILLRYPTLDLRHIYSVIAYYLWHRDIVDAYLEERRKYGEEVEREIRARWPTEGIRERLLARRAVSE